jgi:two-component system sensor histidine kinase KdpD
MLPPARIRAPIRLAVALAAVALTVALLRLIPGINPTTAGFALLIVVLVTATLAPLWMAIVVAAASTVSFNYFFFAPIGTLAIEEPHNWVALFAFLAAAIIGSSLSAAAQARERGELAATLLASLSHDLKTPLTAIRVAVENLRDEMPPAERRAQADAAITELVRLSRLFADLLDMARIDAAALQIQREWVTPADVVDAAVAHVRHAIDGHALRVEADTDRVVHVDARLASVALSHLLENAARYSPADREIVVDARASRNGLEATVSDRGPGLDPREVDRLFERFYRGDYAQQTTAGTGMGLAIARGLLKAIGGRVWAENGAGGGARFSIAVPGPTRPLEVKA